MAFSGGVFSLVAGNPVTTETIISSVWANETLSDIAVGLSTCITNDGQSTVFSDIPFSGKKITDLGSATLLTDGLNNTFLQTGTGAVSRTMTGKVGEIVSVIDFGAVGDGVTNDLDAFTNAIARLSAGGRLMVPAGRYLFTITGDSDTMLLPSDFTLDCEEGTVFQWNYLGSPLFAIVDQENVLIKGVTFEWNGVLANVPGVSGPRFGWTGTLNNRDYCTHVASLGSSKVRIVDSGCHVVGDAPSATTECFCIFATFFPKSDLTTKTYDNEVRNCSIDDVVQGVLLSAQESFKFRGITQRRFPGDHPIGGGSGIAGHLIYTASNGGAVRSTGMEIRDIVDEGIPIGSIVGRGDKLLQIRTASETIVSGVISRRPTGALTCSEFVNSLVTDLIWKPTTAIASGMTSTTDNSIGIEDCQFKNMTFVLPDSNDEAAIFVQTMERSLVEAQISASHTASSVGSAKFSTCTDSRIEVDYMARNATTQQPVRLSTNSDSNTILIHPIGTNQSIRPFIDTGCLNNTVQIEDTVLLAWEKDSWWTTESDSPAMGYVPLKKSKVFRIGTTTDPTTTFQLPRAGVWLGVVSLFDSTGAHLLAGLYRIAWNSGSLQSVELLGTQWTVGANAPTVLTLAVASTGVVTMTSTAGSRAWDIQYDFTCVGNYGTTDL